MQESHGQLWEGPLPRVCMCPCGWWASPVEWFAQNLGSSPGLAALVLEWRFRKWSKCIYFCVFVARLESWCFSLQSHFSMLCSVKPSPLQQLKPASCPARQSWGIWGASWGEVGAARRADWVCEVESLRVRSLHRWQQQHPLKLLRNTDSPSPPKNGEWGSSPFPESTYSLRDPRRGPGICVLAHPPGDPESKRRTIGRLL